MSKMAIIAFYNLALFGGTAYLVFYHGISAWWFIVPFLLSGSHSTK